jgi:hypothetical protein
VSQKVVYGANWRQVWREGAAPLFSTEGLEALKIALETDDPRLMQGATTSPPPLLCVQEWLVEKACLTAFPGVIDLGGFGVCIVGEAEERFARVCYEIDQRMGEAAACRYLLNWFDETPRQEVRREMLVEVELALASRAEPSCSVEVPV